MSAIRNIFACLVHENLECVIDLVRNLRALDPDSMVLLYNGSNDPDLLRDSFPFERYNAVIHPSPRPLEWGHLHPFALDCMKWACDNYQFDTLTIVNSDHLAVRPGYTSTSWLPIYKGGLVSAFWAARLPSIHVPGDPHRPGGGRIAGTGPMATASPMFSGWRTEIRPLVLLAIHDLHRRRGARSDRAVHVELAAAEHHAPDAHMGHPGQVRYFLHWWRCWATKLPSIHAAAIMSSIAYSFTTRQLERRV